MEKNKIYEKINTFLSSDRFINSLSENFFESFNNKIIKVTLTDISEDIIIEFQESSIRIHEKAGSPDVEILSSTVNLLLFVITQGSESFSKNIVIKGDIDTANKFNNFLSNSDELKYFLSNFIGNDYFETLQKLYTSVVPSVKSSLSERENEFRDYLLYDLKILPTKSEINKFLDDVDDIKSRTDNLIKKYKL
tara:strand:- start:1959 stop:2537 length:579 start_codon:yes stop_codon:yes gene_type:complete